MARFPSFYGWIVFQNVYVYTDMYTAHFLFPLIHWWKQAASASWLLWRILLWTCGCRYLYKKVILFPLEIFKLLDPMAVLLFFFFFFSFLGPHLRHMEASRLGIKSELHLPTYATAMWDPSHVWDLYHSSRQLWSLNPLSKARDQTCILLDIRRIFYRWAMMGTPNFYFFEKPP